MTLPTPAPQQIAAPFNLHETIVSGAAMTMSAAYNCYQSSATTGVTGYLFPIADVPDGFMLWVKNVGSGTVSLQPGIGPTSDVSDTLPAGYSGLSAGQALCIMATKPSSLNGTAGYPWVGLVKSQ